MTRNQFLALTVSSIIVALLFLTQVLENRAAQSGSQDLTEMSRVVRNGQTYYDKWKQIALRTYQMSQSDSGLKQVLDRQQITITPPPAPADSTTSSPAASDNTITDKP